MHSLERKEIPDGNEVDLIVFLYPILKCWKFIVLITILCAAAAFTISKIIPKTYASSTSIYIQQSSGAASMLKSLPISLSGVSGGSSGYFLALLNSNKLTKIVIDKLNLQNDLKYQDRKKLKTTELLRKFKENTTVMEDSKSNTINITSKAYSPELAANIANTMAESLDLLVVKSSAKKAEFIEKKLNQTSEELNKAEDKLKDFLVNNDITSINDTAQAYISQLSDLEAKLTEMDVQNQALSSELQNSGNLNALVEQEVKKKAVDSSREYVVQKRDELRAKLHNMPEIATKYAGLSRNIAVLEKTYEVLTEQYQLASITQQGEDGDYQIIDRAEPDTKPVAPRVVLNTALGAFLGMILSIFAVKVRTSVSEIKGVQLNENK